MKPVTAHHHNQQTKSTPEEALEGTDTGCAPLISISGYRRSLPKTVCTWICVALTAGLLGAIFFWKRVWFLKCTHSPCDDLTLADRVLVEDANGLRYIEEIATFVPRHDKADRNHPFIEQPMGGGRFESVPNIRYFRNRRKTYLYKPLCNSFYELGCQEKGMSLATFDLSYAAAFFATTGLPEELYCLGRPVEIDESRRANRLQVFGPNDLAIPVPSFVSIMFAEVLTPFYAFQAFSVTLWYNDDYWFYATCILIISLLTLIKTTRDIKRDRQTLSNKLSPNLKGSKVKNKGAINSYVGPTVQVYLSPNTESYAEIPARDLVPGDILRIPPRLDPILGYPIPCDAVLIHGSCIVDECMLTGESIPVTKSPINKTDENPRERCIRRRKSNQGRHASVISRGSMSDWNALDKEHHAKHVLFNGTKILQTRVFENDCVKAYVISTGFQTTKGRMVLNFLYPKPNEFRFDQDSYKFIAALFSLSLLGLIYSLTLKILQGVPVKQIVIRSLDLVAIVVPPALPAAMTVGMMFAQKRLKKHSVLCISPDHVNACAVIDVMCFDKTGTLTEEGLDIWGALPTQYLPLAPSRKGLLLSHQDSVVTDDTSSHLWDSDGSASADYNTRDSKARFVSEKLERLDPIVFNEATRGGSGGSIQAIALDPTHNFSICAAVCHSLTLINETIIGDPLEIKMFQFSGWSMTDPNVCPATANSVTADFLNSYRDGPEQLDELNSGPIESGGGGAGGDYKCDMLLSGIFNPPDHLDQSPDPGGVSLKDQEAGDHISYTSTPMLKRQLRRDAYQYGVIHQYPFAPALQRMSVLVRRLMGPHFELYAKGAPEVMQKLCKADSLPTDYGTILNSLADQGFRVIACAYRPLPDFKLTGIKKISRKELEQELTFLGFLVFQNKLKAKSGETLDVLRAANIRSVMVTGDNILTALSVAKESRLIPENIDEACLVDAIPDPLHPSQLKITFTAKKLAAPTLSHLSASSQITEPGETKSQLSPTNANHKNPALDLSNPKVKSPIWGFITRLCGHLKTCCFKTHKKGGVNGGDEPLKPTLFGPGPVKGLPCNGVVIDPVAREVYTVFNEWGQPCYITPRTVFALTGPTFEAIETYRRRRTMSIVDVSESAQTICRTSLGGRKPSNADQNLEPVTNIPLVQNDGLPNCTNASLAFSFDSPLANGKINGFSKRTPSTVIDMPPDFCSVTKDGQSPFTTDHFLDYLLTHQCLVFARMTPDQKTRLVRALQSLDYFVGMCGDGANDCGALKSAHMGISLATLPPPTQESNDGAPKLPDEKPAISAPVTGGEASLAAPFTAECGDISCVPHVIREGRASLVTSFGVFKGMACYSLNQFFAVLALYWLTTNFSDTQFAYVDFFAATILTMLMGYTKAYPRLEGHHKPDSSLAGASHIGSVIGHISINVAFLMVVFQWTRGQSWAVVHDPAWDPKNKYYPHVVTAFFVLTSFQYISFPVTFSRGPPFRRVFTTNIPFLVTCIALTLASIYFTLGIPYWPALAKFFKFRYGPSLWPGLFYLTLAFANFLVASFFETVVLGQWLAPYLRQRDLFLRKTIPRHQVLGNFRAWAQVFKGFGGQSYNITGPTSYLSTQETPLDPKVDMAYESDDILKTKL